jgi:hypothetical protein
VECTELVEGNTILGKRRLIIGKLGTGIDLQAKTNLLFRALARNELKLALCEIHKGLP